MRKLVCEMLIKLELKTPHFTRKYKLPWNILWLKRFTCLERGIRKKT